MKSKLRAPFFLLVAGLFLSFISDAQSISGTITDQEEAVAFANVLVLTLPDSNFITGTTTDDAGKFVIKDLDQPTALLKVSALGYEDQWLEISETKRDYKIKLNRTTLQLDEVTVSGKKALYELQQDRLVVNISASPAFSGNNALQLLQKSPGVVVNRQNESISLNAKGQVLVMINDRIQRVPTSVLLARLEGMQAEQVERIELIHQPSARYDASGAAGIIHIVLKENQNQGTNGNAALTVGYGQREKFGLNLGLNSRHGKLNVYGDYTFNWNPQGLFDVNHYREYIYQGDLYYYENLVSLEDHQNYQHAANLGVDLNLGESTLVGGLISYANTFQGFDFRGLSNDFVNQMMRNQSEFLLFPVTRMDNIIGNFNVLQELNERSELSLNIDYAKIDFDNTGDIESTQYGNLTEIKAERQTPIDIWTFKLDYTNQLAKDTKLEIGTKATLNDVSSTARVRDLENPDWVGNNLFSGTDIISERILAGYASFSKDFGPKINGEIGLRFEHYDYQLDAAKDEDDLEQTFNNLFPIIRFNYQVDSLNSLQLTFNRTIVRPSFNSISAYFVFLDPSILVFGNPQLKPTFTNTYKLSWQRRSVIFSLAYLRTVNQIYNYNTVDKPNHIQTSVPSNLDLNRIWEVNISFPLYLTDWWEINCYLTVFYHQVKDASRRMEPFENKIVSYTGQINSSFSWGNGWSASFDGRYMSDYLYGDQEQFLYPYLNLGIRKKFDSGSALSLSVQDVTNTSGRITWDYNQPSLGIRTFGDNDWSERQFRLTYTFNFGNQKLREKRKRSTGEDVRSRL